MAKRGRVNRATVQEEEEKLRPVRLRKYKYLILVVCEDGKTEPYYVSRFRAQMPPESIYLRTVGAGKDSLGVVHQSIMEKARLASEAAKSVDEVWVLFDKDDADLKEANSQRFHQAFKIAQSEQIQVAYSNEVFELWLLLHLEDVDPAVSIPRSVIYNRLEQVVRQFAGYEHFEYRHGEIEVVEVIGEIGNESDAMQRAIRLQAFHRNQIPLFANPITLVDQLVRRLRDWIAYFDYQP